MTIYRRGNFHSIAGHTQGSLTLESICLQLHQAALIIFTVLKLAQGVSERNYPSYHDSNTRKARKIKIKRQQEGKIEGTLGSCFQECNPRKKKAGLKILFLPPVFQNVPVAA